MNKPSPTQTLEYEAKRFSAMLEHPKLGAMTLALVQNNSAALSNPKGIGIGDFAKIHNIPTSTLRYYVELGLVTPVTVNGKFRFSFQNIAEIEQVLHWSSLGMKLEEIAKRHNTSLGGSEINGKPILHHKITDPAMLKAIQERFTKEGNPAILTAEAALELVAQLGLTPEAPKQRLLEDYDEIIARLEVKQQEIQTQLERAKASRERLQQEQICELQ